MNMHPLIEKIHFLESKLGEKWTHPILEPFKFNTKDIYEVQKAGQKISHHIGLPSLIFIITYSHQKTNVAGNINLDNSSDVYIEIDDGILNDCDIVLAVLAHEICHKYLHFNNLKLFPEFENEILTDVATIYTGLGKFSLNGCEKKSTVTKTFINSTETSTITQKVGYMNRHQFAFVYRLICNMRKTSEKLMLSGLTEDAYAELRDISKEYFDFFSKNYFSNDLALRTIDDLLNNEIGDSQKKFAVFNKNIRITQECILENATHLYQDFHSFTKSKIDALQREAITSHKNDSFNYIKNLIAIEESKYLKIKNIQKCNEIAQLELTLQKLINFLLKSPLHQQLKNDFEFLYQFKCPICKTQMRIGEKKLARVKCANSKCNYSFIVDTGVDYFDYSQSLKGSKRGIKNRLFAKIISFFSKSK